VTVSEYFIQEEKYSKPTRSSNNIRQKNNQLCRKDPAWGWHTVDGEVKREAGRHVDHL